MLTLLHKKYGSRFLLLFTFIILFPPTPNAQPRSPRLTGVIVGEGLFFTGTFVSLHFLWYKKYSTGHFHFFNDNSEWLQMDKLGHATTGYTMSALSTGLYQWAGMKQEPALWTGALTSLAFLSMIEVFDGFSDKWGFSGGDMIANLAGIGLASSQTALWGEQRISLRYSYHATIFPAYRPEELGQNKWQSMLKDYNGQSYWLSIAPIHFLTAKTDYPQWLNIAVGYGAEGMVTGRIQGNEAAPFIRQRIFLGALDINYWGMIKFPSPALRYKARDKHLKLLPLYY